jgi:prepilin-type N-terminal cleavage/methylation domain-containing protein
VARAAAGAGFSLIEMLFVLAIIATLAGIGIPLTANALDEMRVGMATRYLAGRVIAARLDALQRSTALGLRFEMAGTDYAFATCADGNGNGLRSAEIASGTDPQVAPAESLSQHFADVHFGLTAGVPDLDGQRSADDADGVRIGSSRILTLGPDGTATSGTLYIRGRRGQYAIRILGATARMRIFQYRTGAREWIAR